MWLNYSSANDKWGKQTKSYVLVGPGFNSVSSHSNRNIDSNVIKIPALYKVMVLTAQEH